MRSLYGCQCEGGTAERRSNWRVVHWRCNYSAFGGGRRTSSAYSRIACLKCGATWRTKAFYVNLLPQVKEGEKW